jgi:hypothetical protein
MDVISFLNMMKSLYDEFGTIKPIKDLVCKYIVKHRYSHDS